MGGGGKGLQQVGDFWIGWGPLGSMDPTVAGDGVH